MKAVWNGKVIAESGDTIVVEGNHYFPEGSLKREYVEPSDKTTYCPWKGTANYYSLNVDGKTNDAAVWYYADPKPEAEPIRGRVAFWNGVEVSED